MFTWKYFNQPFYHTVKFPVASIDQTKNTINFAIITAISDVRWVQTASLMVLRILNAKWSEKYHFLKNIYFWSTFLNNGSILFSLETMTLPQQEHNLVNWVNDGNI